MTKKRFIETLSTGIVTDTVTGKEYQCEMRIDDKLLELLNQIFDENEQLKQENERLCNFNLHMLLDEKNKEIKHLNEENEELKEIIEDISDMDKETDIEMQHINNIYKKYGFKGVIEYAKDKLQTYGAVREVDDGLWLFATGGWSDNEHWLHLLKEWSFIYGRGHYRAITTGGGYYYSEEPYAGITIRLKREEND